MQEAIRSGDLIKRIYYDGFFPDNYIVIDFLRGNATLRIKYNCNSKEAKFWLRAYNNNVGHIFYFRKELISKCSNLIEKRTEKIREIEKFLDEIINGDKAEIANTNSKNFIVRIAEKIKNKFRRR